MNPILAALDVSSREQALRLAGVLRGHVGGFKIGSELFTAEGPAIVRELAALGDRIFLDLKFHDIPNTVAGAVRSAGRLGVWMMNVHASGGSRMMQAAAAAAREVAETTGQRPLLIAVTVLTSLDEIALEALGITRPTATQVQMLAAMAQDAGLDGVVASPQEITAIRARCGSDFLIVTPGIRTAPVDAHDDQVRTMSAAEAIAAGANYLVIGRPIVRADDPAAAADEILSRLKQNG